MKKAYLAIALAAPLLFCGCQSYTTGLVDVDRASASDKGIVVTGFDDNPFFANIHYDYSKVENFNPSNLKVSLVRTSNSDEDSPLEFLGYELLEDDHSWFMMTAASENKPRQYSRDAVVVSHEPGHIRLFSMDDIGTYVLSYEN